jgi:hypothetical protein
MPDEETSGGFEVVLPPTDGVTEQPSGGFTINMPGTEGESSGGFTINLPSTTPPSYTSSSPIDTAWQIMYDHLQTGAYAISTNNIFSAWNDKLVEDVGMPLIVIYPPSFSRSCLSLNGAVVQDPVSFTLEIYHKTSKDVKQLTDEIISKLVNGYSVFATSGLKRDMKNWIKTVDYSAWTNGNHRLHRYTIEANYKAMDTLSVGNSAGGSTVIEVVDMPNTEYYTGSDCSGTDGGVNRMLILANTELSYEEQVTVNGLVMALTEDYTIQHLSSGSTIIFLNAINNDFILSVRYYT